MGVSLENLVETRSSRAVINPIHFTTIEPFAGWPTCEKVVYESRQPGSYQEHVALQDRQSVTVQLLMRGRLRCRADRSSSWILAGPGQALVYDAGVHGSLEYLGDPDGGHLEFIYANLVGECMRSAVQGIVARAGHVVPVHGGEELITRWSGKLITRSAAPMHRCLSVVEANDLCWSFVHPLARGLAPTDRLAERAMAMLTDSWQQPLPMAVVARHLKVTREHLSRILRAACGLPPSQWLSRYRLGRAADLLESGISIEDVARQCGYCSTQHFIHCFRRVNGTTPGRWVRRTLASVATGAADETANVT